MRFVLVGNYGAGNIGDDALREYFSSLLHDHSLEIVSAVDSADYSSIPRLPFGLRSLFRPWWRTISSIARSDGVIFGSGTLFTDTESVTACMMWWMYAACARLFSRPYYLAFQGVGPFRTRIGQAIATSVCERASFISVRDEPSLDRIRHWDLGVTPVLSFDPAFQRFALAHHVDRGRVLTLIPRHTSGEAFTLAVMAAAESGDFDAIKILLMDPLSAEQIVAERLVALPSMRNATIIPLSSVSEFLTAISDASLVVSERFHGLLAAVALRIPFRVVSSHPGDKFSTLARYADPQSTHCDEILTLVTQGAEALQAALLIQPSRNTMPTPGVSVS